MSLAKRFSKITTVLFCILISAAAYSQKNNSGNEPACPLPGGDWKYIPDLSDEFNGRALDTLKWYSYNPEWKGRPPGYFSPANVTVDTGNLILTAKTETLKGLPAEYHTFTTAAVKSRQRMLYGYYEVKFKPMDSRASRHLLASAA